MPSRGYIAGKPVSRWEADSDQIDIEYKNLDKPIQSQYNPCPQCLSGKKGIIIKVSLDHNAVVGEREREKREREREREREKEREIDKPIQSQYNPCPQCLGGKRGIIIKVSRDHNAVVGEREREKREREREKEREIDKPIQSQYNPCPQCLSGKRGIIIKVSLDHNAVVGEREREKRERERERERERNRQAYTVSVQPVSTVP